MLFIIFGAGASYDNDGYTPTATPGYSSIPLANGLIDGNLHFATEAQAKWHGAVSVLNHLRRIKSENPEGFNIESELFLELERKNEDVRAQLLAFKYYVHDVIRNAEAKVRGRNQANTNYTHLFGKLQRAGIDMEMGIALVTFNYDTLIETACTQTYPGWGFNDYNEYILGCPVARLYKPHGSLNWRRNITLKDVAGRNSVVRVLSNPQTFPVAEEQEVITTYDSGYSAEVTGEISLAEPVIALPYKEKTTLIFPEPHNMSLLDDIRNVTHILTIGWKGTEEHFNQQVLSTIPAESKLKVMCVTSGGLETEKSLKKALGARIEEITTSGDGFTGFLNSDKLDKFLS